METTQQAALKKLLDKLIEYRKELDKNDTRYVLEDLCSFLRWDVDLQTLESLREALC